MNCTEEVKEEVNKKIYNQNSEKSKYQGYLNYLIYLRNKPLRGMAINKLPIQKLILLKKTTYLTCFL